MREIAPAVHAIEHSSAFAIDSPTASAVADLASAVGLTGSVVANGEG